ncbi:hypothetical protein QAD02_023718 [Eretmocerus hayati]|uniref:Uncharacterized protein n=1 Tax=Eretmocerus hayati TaxID=131215 RepID=A0ACC2PWQ3_9HYME|nr:hypothetical protein QAD02_023718 [Eretmocerus hayati]
MGKLVEGLGNARERFLSLPELLRPKTLSTESSDRIDLASSNTHLLHRKSQISLWHIRHLLRQNLDNDTKTSVVRGEMCKAALYRHRLIHETTADMHEVMMNRLPEFDLSDYTEANIFSSPRVNIKVVGLMKDECGVCIMVISASMRSELYSYKMTDGEVTKKAKSVKSVTMKTVEFEDYVACLKEIKYLVLKTNPMMLSFLL